MQNIIIVVSFYCVRKHSPWMTCLINFINNECSSMVSVWFCIGIEKFGLFIFLTSCDDVGLHSLWLVVSYITHNAPKILILLIKIHFVFTLLISQHRKILTSTQPFPGFLRLQKCWLVWAVQKFQCWHHVPETSLRLMVPLSEPVSRNIWAVLSLKVVKTW